VLTEVQAHLHLLKLRALLRREHLFDLAVSLFDLFAYAGANAGEMGLDARVMALDDLGDLFLLRIVELEAPVETLHKRLGSELRHGSPAMEDAVPDHADRHARDESHGESDDGDDRGLSSRQDRCLRPW
jgi:hypothetical protein